MEQSELVYEYWLASICHISAGKKICAVEQLGSARAVWESDPILLYQAQVITREEQKLLTEAQKQELPHSAMQEMEKQQIHIATWMMDHYPERLRNISTPPFAIFYRGTLPDEKKTVGIVGARMCSEAGRSLASLLGRRLAEHQVNVISGMAIGIDSAAHAGALQANGLTFAVLGCGCDICYPKSSRNLYDQMCGYSGGVLSEYLPGVLPVPYHFPERNRILSGLTDILVVVEAKERSGSLITADFALDQGKDIFAVPGRYDDTLYKGCNRLIAQGAGILYDVDAFLESIHVVDEMGGPSAKVTKILLEKEERLVYSCLDLQPKSMNDLIRETGLDVLTIFHSIGELKRKRLVQETFQNYFCRRL